MSRFLTSLSTGRRFCKYCGSENCNCMDDGITGLDFRYVEAKTEKATLFLLKKQVLPNGKIIPTGASVWFKNECIYQIDDVLKRVAIDNDAINRMVFDQC